MIASGVASPRARRSPAVLVRAALLLAATAAAVAPVTACGRRGNRARGGSGDGAAGDDGGTGGAAAAVTVTGTALFAGPAQTCLIVDGAATCAGSAAEQALTFTVDVARCGPAAEPCAPTFAPVETGGPVRAVTFAADATCWLRADRRVACQGADRWGGLGQVEPPATNCPGDSLLPCQPTPTPVGDLDDIIQLVGGGTYFCALDGDGAVWCWGTGNLGQLGLPTRRLCGTSFVHACGAVYTQVPGLPPIRQIAAGQASMLALDRDGRVWTWGAVLGARGRFVARPVASPDEAPARIVDGLPTPVDDIAASGALACASAAGEVRCWGDLTMSYYADEHTVSEHPVELDLPAVERLAGGAEAGHMCAVDRARHVWCWGIGHFGELGQGDAADHPEPVELPGLHGAVELALGRRHTCARTPDGVTCTGAGTHGQVAHATETCGGEIGLGVPEVACALRPTRW